MTQQRVGKHKFVQFTYSITDQNGEVVEQIDIPVSYVHGADSGMFEKIEAAMQGHRAGDRVEVEMNPEEGFGQHDPELTFADDISNVPEQFRQIGAEVEMQNDRGETRKFFVSKIENDRLTVDGNHPLAGKTLTFHIEVRDIRDATHEEIQHGGAPVGPQLH
ncbi:MAG: FKBP-type peptidyl-prolyl cis-trans isomerase [Pseudomonadota bacterium]|nr:FKBP-type peptidyl-prolyl cis-trans isomerase [Pseudomonadota bacterium]